MRGEILYTAMAGIILAGVFIVSISFLMTGMIETGIEEQQTTEQLRAESAAYLVENCLKHGKEHLDQEFMENNKRGDICELCGICGDVVAKVDDLEDVRKSWNFGYSLTEVRSEITVSILYGDGIVHAGRLYAAVE